MRRVFKLCDRRRIAAASWAAAALLMLLLGGCAARPAAASGPEAVNQAAERLAGWLRRNVSHEGAGAGEFLSAMNNLYDWPEIGLMQYDGRGFADYLALTEQYVGQAWQAPDGFRKATDLERLTLAVSAAGGDARDVGGHDLIAALCSHSRFDMQGVNSPIFALIALDSKGYAVPDGAAWTRRKMLDLILEHRNKDGSFDLSGSGEGDPDITAMAIQALWRYMDDREIRETVGNAAIWLSNAQQDNGGYISWGAEGSESAAQVIIAMCCLGVDVTADPRFSKDGGNPLTFLLEHQTEDGGFRHTLDGGADKMASEQAMLALGAWLRLKGGQPALYDYDD